MPEVTWLASDCWDVSLGRACSLSICLFYPSKTIHISSRASSCLQVLHGSKSILRRKHFMKGYGRQCHDSNQEMSALRTLVLNYKVSVQLLLKLSMYSIYWNRPCVLIILSDFLMYLLAVYFIVIMGRILTSCPDIFEILVYFPFLYWLAI